jgi:hypothetical protein
MILIVECTGVNIAFQSPLLIIDRRSVLVMYEYYPTHRVSRLRVYTLRDRFVIIRNRKELFRNAPNDIGRVPVISEMFR